MRWFHGVAAYLLGALARNLCLLPHGRGLCLRVGPQPGRARPRAVREAAEDREVACALRCRIPAVVSKLEE